MLRHPLSISQLQISIHAPTRGATCETCNYCHNNRFQSTLPREEQHMNQMHIPIIHNFNPHSHERSDFVPRRISRYIVISIHAPTRGATGWRFRLFANSAISIHAPTRGETAILHKKSVYFYTIPIINI